MLHYKHNQLKKVILVRILVNLLNKFAVDNLIQNDTQVHNQRRILRESQTDDRLKQVHFVVVLTQVSVRQFGDD